jgi:Ran GTPase-activating protein (RanGAP) involved in mRNA processing and transport
MGGGEVRFEDLRAHMARELDPQDTGSRRRWGSVLLGLLSRAREEDPGRYDDEWVGYLAGFRARWREPLVTATALAQLEWLITLLPCATFGYSTRALHTWQPEPLEGWLGAEAMRHVSRLEFDAESASDVLGALAEAEHLTGLESLYVHAPEFTEADGVLLGAHERFSRLRRLELRVDAAPPAALEPVLTSENVADLEVFHLLGPEPSKDALAHIIAGAAHLRSLKTLGLRGAGIGAKGARALAGSPNVARLERLDLSDCAIGVKGMEAFAESEHLTQLRWLDLQSNTLKDAGAIALAGSENFANLAYLRLDYNGLKDAGAVALAESEHLCHVQELDLRNNRFKVDGLRALARSEHLSGSVRRIFMMNLTDKLKLSEQLEDLASMGLTDLTRKKGDEIRAAMRGWRGAPSARLAGAMYAEEQLEGKQVVELVELLEEASERDPEAYQERWLPYMERAIDERDDGFLVFLREPEQVELLVRLAPLLPKACVSLSLGYMGVDDARLEELLASRSLRCVAQLLLYGTPLSNAGLARLLGSEDVSGVTRLWMSKFALDEVGASALATSPWLGRVEWLYLCESGLTGEWLEQMMGGSLMSGLTALVLEGNPLGDQGARALAEATSVHTLERMTLDKTGITDDGLLALARSLHLSRLEHLNLTGNPIHGGAFVELAGAPEVNRLRNLSLDESKITAAAYVPWVRSWFVKDIDGVYGYDHRHAREILRVAGVDLDEAKDARWSLKGQVLPRLIW